MRKSRGRTNVDSRLTLCEAWKRPKAPPLERSKSNKRYWPAAKVSVTNASSRQKSRTGRARQLQPDRVQRDDRDHSDPADGDEAVVLLAEAEALPHRREADVDDEQRDA